MEEVFSRGDLARTPFALVLAELWRKTLTGMLSVRGPSGSKTFFIESGSLGLARGAFDEKAFLSYLLASGEADLISLARCEEHAQSAGGSLLRALIETSLVGPDRLWKLLESHAVEEVTAPFDWEQGEFDFQAGPVSPGPALLRGLDLAAVVLQGVRRMRKAGIIASFLPAESVTVRGLSPDFLGRLGLAAHERYILHLLEPAKTVAELLAASDLGQAESRRILFALLCLGVAGTLPSKPKTGRLTPEPPSADLDKLFGIFNNKCSAVFKHMSKEIGPVAQSVIEKSLEEIRGRLDPAFQEMELKPDGRIELKTFLRLNMNLVGEESRRGLLRSMDEILMAEVLAVKRTLGPAHEAALVRSLERIGDSA